MELFHKQIKVKQIILTAGRCKSEFLMDFPKRRQILNLKPDAVFEVEKMSKQTPQKNKKENKNKAQQRARKHSEPEQMKEEST